MQASIHRTRRGFTLVELLLVIAVSAVLIGLAVPSMQSLVLGFRARTASDTLFASMALSRSEAIKRNTRTVLCRSSDGLGCATSGGWEQGWIVFVDSRNNGRVDPGEAILLRQQALAPDIYLTPHFTVAGYISYTPLGWAQTVNGAMLMGNFMVCQKSAGPVEGRKIVLSAAGRARTTRTTEAHCP